MIDLSTFGENLNVALFGATGGIGDSFLRQLNACPQVDYIHAFSRNEMTTNGKIIPGKFDILDDRSLADAAAQIKQHGPISLCLVATGVLQSGEIRPEKTNSALDRSVMEAMFALNTIGPALIARHMLPLLAKDQKAGFAALSARVGSISDNHLGGWHSYRASKAALNMMIKTMSIEMALKQPLGFIVGLHPGTVDTKLSAPFQKNVPEGTLFTPGFSVESMLMVLNTLTNKDSGKCFDYAGKEIPA